jgi:hypothetical protein
VKPVELYANLGQEHIDAFYAELSGKEIREVLRAGETSASVSSAAFTQKARRKAWRRRFDAEALTKSNEKLAFAFLIEWLLRHHRALLIDYLDFLGVKHTQGETDDDFCESREPEKLREGVQMLLEKYSAHHVATYVLLIGHVQETHVFDQTPSVLSALGFDDAKAAAYVAANIEANGVAQKKEPVATAS